MEGVRGRGFLGGPPAWTKAGGQGWPQVLRAQKKRQVKGQLLTASGPQLPFGSSACLSVISEHGGLREEHLMTQRRQDLGWRGSQEISGEGALLFLDQAPCGHQTWQHLLPPPRSSTGDVLRQDGF